MPAVVPVVRGRDIPREKEPWGGRVVLAGEKRAKILP